MNKLGKSDLKIPEWFSLLQSDSLLTSKEVANLLGYSHPDTFTRAVRMGKYPQADVTTIKNHRTVKMWRVEKVRKIIEEKINEK